MPNPNVREIATVEDIDGAAVRIGVDYDAVTVGGHRFAGETLAKFRRGFVTANEQARRQGAAMAAQAEKATPDFPPLIAAADTDDPAKPWRVADESGNAADYPDHRAARIAMDGVRGSSAVYVRADDGEWWLFETLLREA